MKASEKKITTENTNVNATEEISFWDTVLLGIEFVGDGNGSDGSGFEFVDLETRMGLNCLDWTAYSITKKFILNRDYLPLSWHNACTKLRRRDKAIDNYSVYVPEFCVNNKQSDYPHRETIPSPFYTSGNDSVDDLRAECRLALLNALRDGDRPNAVKRAFKALENSHSYGRYRDKDNMAKSRRETIEHRPYRAMVVKGFGVEYDKFDCSENDLGTETPFGSLSPSDFAFVDRLVNVVDRVKTAHKFATPEKFLCAVCYCLDMPAVEAVPLVYGVKIDGKKYKSRSQLYSKNAKEVINWILEDIESNPEGLDKWVKAIKHIEKMHEAEDRLKEASVKYMLTDEMTADLKKKIETSPEMVLMFCDALEKNITYLNN